MRDQSEQGISLLPALCGTSDSHWLTIDLTEYLRYPLQLQVQGWHGPKPFAWRSFSHGEPLAKGAFLEAPGIPLPGSLYRDVPHTVATVGSMAPLWRYALLQACARIPAALELANDNPLLLILLVEHAQRMGWSERQLTACLASRRPVILAAIGLPGSVSLARLLRRMALVPVTSPLLTIIRECLQQPETIKLLRHQARPSLNHLWLMHRFRQELVWPGLLNMVDDTTSLHEMIWLRRMSADIQRMAPDNTQLHRARTQQALQQLHDRLVEQFNAAQRGRSAEQLAHEHGDYPLPPLPGNTLIQPLNGWVDLLLEGDRMHHCIGSYAARIATRRVSVYHMQAPEPITIAIVKRGNRWQLEEARGHCNTLPSSASLETIHQWLSEGSGSQK